MKLGLGTKLTTGMTLTPQMQQAIRLLQLSSLELEQEVQQKLDSNPLLEREDDEDWLADRGHNEGFANNQLTDGELEWEDNWQRNANESDSEAWDERDIAIDKETERDTGGQTNWQDDWQAGKLPETTLTSRHDHPKYDSYDSHDSYDSYDNDSYDNDDWQEIGQDGIDSAEHFAANHFDINIDTQWDDVYTHEPTSLARADTDEFDDEHRFSTQGNIQDHVRWQLNFKHLSSLDMMIAEYLIDSMDERGFIGLSTEELYHSLDTMLAFYQLDDVELTPDDIEVVVKQIQNCEPLGVGARNLAECLLLQLKPLPADTPYLTQAKQLLAYPDYFSNNNINALVKATGLSLDDIPPSLALLRTLNPNPALSYQQSQRQYDNSPESYDIPDVLVTPTAQGWQVQLNPDTLPKLRINQHYASLVHRNDNSEQGVYLKEQLHDARLFIRSIQERNQNLLKVATCIVKRQQGFFEQGVTAMQPMILKDVADEVGLHESTVSRITTSKTMLTPKGLYSLKYFFSSQVSNDEGDGVSSTAISAMIKQMIEQEDPKKPLSDSALMDKLKANGIDIARRTITKYREAMNIGSSTQRKQRY